MFGAIHRGNVIRQRLLGQLAKPSYCSQAPKRLEKILIANRGEITCRIINTAKRMGVKTVSVYCDAESNGKHVQLAEEAYRLGPPPATSSYLEKEKVIAVAKASGAQGIHPGYGFLSENAEFAQMCTDNGIEFIGPPASAISSMGSKSASKEIMIAAGVPVTPGYQGTNQDPDFLHVEAEKIGYPVLIKAAAGGGGRGMRVVPSSDQFLEQLEGAKREARKYFSDEEVILEKFIETSRHVEVQVFADKYGNCVYFYERDCSVQRRHQKVLEEAPAPMLSDKLRTRMGEVAVAAAKAVNYVGAGTVEFLFDPKTKEFFFMEMNTRLQVEHPVTEAIVGLDLVELQIKIAGGEPLPFKQEDVAMTGHAIEARIYAEDTAAGFLPGSGTLKYVQLPSGCIEGKSMGPHSDERDVVVRVDSGFRQGDEVLVYYDSMISKLIVWGKDRDMALLHMKRALDEYKVIGVPTNIEFLKKAVCHPEFQNPTNLSTKFIPDNADDLLTPTIHTPEHYAMAFFGVWQKEAFGHPIGPFRPNLNATFNAEFVEEGSSLIVSGTQIKDGLWVVACPAKGWSLEVECKVPTPSQGLATQDLTLFIAGQRHQLMAYVSPSSVDLVTTDQVLSLSRVTLPDTFGEVDADGSSGSSVLAPMPGKIIKIVTPTGTTVQKGDLIAVLEAMKMEHSIKASCDGVVEMLVAEGDMVMQKNTLAKVEVAE